jgi:hypothetical protein
MLEPFASPLSDRNLFWASVGRSGASIPPHARPHRRRSPDAQEECWHVYYGDVRVGTIALRTGIPHHEDPWGWACGFYPGSHPAECTSGAAATYITKLPKAEHQAAEWQAAMEALILVATSGGPTMFARIGIMRALNAGKPNPAIMPPRKRAKAYKVIR